MIDTLSLFFSIYSKYSMQLDRSGYKSSEYSIQMASWLASGMSWPRASQMSVFSAVLIQTNRLQQTAAVWLVSILPFESC